MTITANALELWRHVYSELSQEHTGLAGSIINRAEAQTLRLSLLYALLDAQGKIKETHLQAALAMWRYAQDSALYIFGERSIDPLEEKILEALKGGPLSASELSAALSRHVPRERLRPTLQQLEAQQRITITKLKNVGRPRIILALRELSELSESSEEKRSPARAFFRDFRFYRFFRHGYVSPQNLRSLMVCRIASLPVVGTR